MSFLEYYEDPPGIVGTQYSTYLNSHDFYQFCKNILDRNFIEFIITFQEIDGVLWKHVYFSEEVKDIKNYFEEITTQDFRSKYLYIKGNGISQNSQEYCGSLTGSRSPTTTELRNLVILKRHIVETFENSKLLKKCASNGVKDENLMAMVLAIRKNVPNNGGSWCMFPNRCRNRSGDNSPESLTKEKKEVCKAATLSLLREKLCNNDTILSQVCRLTMRSIQDSVMVKVSNKHSTYFDNYEFYRDTKPDLWYYRRDYQVRAVFEVIVTLSNANNFTFKYKPEILSMCGINKGTKKSTVLCLYTSLPVSILRSPGEPSDSE